MIDTAEMVRCDGVDRDELEARLRAAAKEIERLRGVQFEQWTRLNAALKPHARGQEQFSEIAARLARERDQLEDQIQIVQARCTELVDEARANRRIANAPPGELVALSHVSHERRLQDDRWGPIEDHLDVPIGSTTGYGFSLRSQREAAASHCASTGRDTCCWAHVILEEAYELLAEPESEPKRIRAEAVQLAACCVKLIEVLDRRANSNPLPVTGGIPLPGWTCTATRLVTDGETTRQACCQTFNGANPKWLKQCRSCGAQGPTEPRPVATPARLDADKTATGKTVLTARVRRGGDGSIAFVPPAEFHIDTETGKRTPLGPEPK